MSSKSFVLGALFVITGITVVAGNGVAQTFRYVAQAGQAPSAPYTGWATAASNIQDAVDAADAGDMVLVSNGVYEAGGRVADGNLTNRVAMTKAMTVRSVNGPSVTAIRGHIVDGKEAVRCVFLSDGAMISGFTLTNGGTWMSAFGDNDNLGGGAAIFNSGTVSNCVITGCAGSAVYCRKGGLVSDCVIQGNTGIIGGGISATGGLVDRCLILDNTASIGGGVQLIKATIRNSLISGNLVNDSTCSGGGIYADEGAVINCMIVWNESYGVGGGFKDPADPGSGQELSTVVNTIIYHNTAPVGSNYYVRTDSYPFDHCCIAPLSGGTGNISEPPMLVGLNNAHILGASPCRGAGTDAVIEEGETDIDGEPRDWGDAVDIGCDQFVSTNILGALDMAIDAPFTNALVNSTLRFRSAIGGKADVHSWDVEIPGETMGMTNTSDWTYAWDTTGTYSMVLSATNRFESGAVTATVTIVSSFTNYFDPAGSHVVPFTNWTTAATNLQDAIDACYDGGGVVMVQTGSHDCATEVFINRSVTVRGVGAEDDTVFTGGGSNRIFTVSAQGAVLERVTIAGGYAEEQGGGLFLDYGTVRHCVITGNTSGLQGGGAHVERYGVMEDCRVTGNQAVKWGGGVEMDGASTRMSRCVVMNNSSGSFGGGVHAKWGALMDNCFFAENYSWGGGGLYLNEATAQNCTFIKNTAEGEGGGVYLVGGILHNCIAYFNKADMAESDNYYKETASTISHSCSTPLPPGTGNIDADPLMAGINNPHILTASPCRAVGDAGAVESGQTDIDGEERISGGKVDIGCDQYIVGAVTGALSVVIRGDTNTNIGVPEPLAADISGKVTGFVWRVALGGGQFEYLTNSLEIAPVWNDAGDYEVVLSAGNEAVSAAATVTVHVVAGGFTNYVSTSGAHVSPFTNWSDAATNIQAAVDACFVGGAVLVQTGRYDIASPLLIEKAVSVQSVGGPELTIIDAGGRCRGVTMTASGASLSGFTITDGYDIGCGGIYMLSGLVSNCIVVSCEGTSMTGGMECHRDAEVHDTIIRGNTAWNWPGGLILSGNALARNCTIENNEAHNRAGGIYFQYGGRAEDCIIRGNSARAGGGVYFLEGGSIYNSMIFSNAAENGAGAHFQKGGYASNCVFRLNWGIYEAGGAWFQEGGIMDDCSLLDNHAGTWKGHGGGALLNDGGLLRDCLIAGNEAAFAGGVWLQNDGEVRRCVIRDNTAVWGEPDVSAGVAGGFYINIGGTLRDTLVTGNTAEQDAGGGVIEYAGNIINCTIVNNTAANRGGGLFVIDYGRVANTILWDNTAATSNNHYLALDKYSPVAISNSCSDPLMPGTNNLAVDPLFVDAADGDWRLHWDSPCIDAGGSVSVSGDTDLDGNPRRAGAREDIGAYEKQVREHILAPARITSAGFLANWEPVTAATNYRLDVATDSGFTNLAPAYADRDAGLVTTFAVTGLIHGVRYYYRVRAESVYGTGVNSTITNTLTVAWASGNDFGGAGSGAFALYDGSSGRWYILMPDGELVCWGEQWGGEGLVPVPGDYDGDGISDMAVFDTVNGLWYIQAWTGSEAGGILAWAEPWGWDGALPVSGDYDGDGISDMVVYNPVNGAWYMRGVDGTLIAWEVYWGGIDFSPVPGDYDGDGIADLAVFDTSHGNWYIVAWDGATTSHLLIWDEPWGWPGAEPVSGDYDGDGVCDMVVYDPVGGHWYLRSVSGILIGWAVPWGGQGLAPVPGDYDGDQVADLAVYGTVSGLWYIYSLDGRVLAWEAAWGAPGLSPVGAW